MSINLSSKLFLLEFKHPFGVSSNTRKETASVFIQLEYNGYKAYGEACLPSYLGETVEDTQSFFEKAKGLLKNVSSLDSLEEILSVIDSISSGNNAAKAAIDIALHDLYAKLSGKTFREMMGFSKTP